jgi:hypothetical protein
MHEGRFGEYRVEGCTYEDSEGVQGWHTRSWPLLHDGKPIHDLFVDGSNFRPVSVPVGEVVNEKCASLVIEDRLISVHSAEQGAILKAIDQWEYEGL